jgi:anti-sigma factor RsiW
MNDHEFELKLQAYLDGELAGREATEVKERLAGHADGRALFAELQNTRAALAGSELELKLPESREFFWSKIQREIEREEKTRVAAPKVHWLAWLRHHLVSVGGAAILTSVVGLMVLHSGPGPLGEMDMAADDMGTYTYRDQQAKMTVVWFYDKSDDSDVAEPAAIASMDTE